MAKQRTSAPISQKSAKHSATTFETILQGKELIGLVILLAVMAGIILHKFLLLEQVYMFKDIGSDTVTQLYPMLFHIKQYLQTEGIPMWTFHQGIGQNIFPTNGIIVDPLTAVNVWLTTGNGLLYGLAYIEWVKIVAAGVFFFLYLRSLAYTQYTAFIGGILYAFCGCVIVWGTWCMSEPLYAAMLLYGFEQVFQRKNWWIVPLAAALMAWYQVVYLYLNGLMLVLYAIIRFTEEERWNGKDVLGFVVAFVALELLGVCISAVFSVNYLDRMLNGPRVGGDASYAQSLKAHPLLGLAPMQSIATAVYRMFSGDMMGTGNAFKGAYNYLEAPLFYGGLVNILLIPQVVVLTKKPRRIVYIIALLCCVVPVVFPFFRYAFWLFTGDYFRTFSLVVTLMLMVLGMRALAIVDAQARIHKLTLGITLAAALLMLIIPLGGFQANPLNTSRQIAAVVFLLAEAGLLLLLAHKNTKSLAQLGLLAAVSLEAIVFSYSGMNDRDVVTTAELGQKIGYNDYSVDAVAAINAQDKSFFRIDKDYYSGPAIHASINDAQYQGYKSTPSYHSFNQQHYVKFLGATGAIDPKNEIQTRWLPGLVQRPMLQTLCNVKYVLSKNPQNLQYWANSGYELIGRTGDVNVLRNKYYLPLGVVYTSIMSEEEWVKMPNAQKDKLLLRAAIVPSARLENFSGLPRLSTRDTTAGVSFEEYGNFVNALKNDTMNISSYNNNSIRGAITLRQKGVLCCPIPFDKGWKAVVNGKEHPIEIIHAGLMGIVLDKGQYTIVLQYEPPLMMKTVLMSGVGIVVWLVLFGWWFMQQRQQRAAKAQIKNNSES